MSVLLVEDMADLRESYAWLLRHAGCEVVAAPDGREALGSVPGFTPEFVLTDFQMPRMDGVELIRRMRSLPGLARVPVAMATANDGQDVESQARAAGAADVVHKPVDVLRLLGRYERAEFAEA